MKKIILLSFFVLVTSFGFSQDTNSQDGRKSTTQKKSTQRQISNTNSQEVSWGVRAGLNISNLDFDPEPMFDNTHRNGFMIGFYADINFSEKFALSPEIQFSAEGAKADDLRAEMGKNAQKTVNRTFDLESSVESYFAKYCKK